MVRNRFLEQIERIQQVYSDRKGQLEIKKRNDTTNDTIKDRGVKVLPELYLDGFKLLKYCSCN